MRLKEFRIESEGLDESLEVSVILHRIELKQNFRFKGKPLNLLSRHDIGQCVKIVDRNIDEYFKGSCVYSLGDLHMIKLIVDQCIKDWH